MVNLTSSRDSNIIGSAGQLANLRSMMLENRQLDSEVVELWTDTILTLSTTL